MTYQLKPAKKPANLFERARKKIWRELVTIPARKRLRQRFIDQLPKYANGPDQNFSIHTLVCSRDVEMAICTFKMLNFVTGQNFKITIHDDGSLLDSDIDLLNRHLNCNILLRSYTDKVAHERLKNYPHILAFRSAQIMALKLIDVGMFCNNRRVAYIDTDVLFFKSPEYYFSLLHETSPIINHFNRDVANAYIKNPEEILKAIGIRPPERINAGLWVMNASDLKFDIIEQWLQMEIFADCKHKYLSDQTFVSMLAATSEYGVNYLPATYDVDLFKKPGECVCKHYVGKIRHGYELEGLQYIFDHLETIRPVPFNESVKQN